jgi:hypothetical protein
MQYERRFAKIGWKRSAASRRPCPEDALHCATVPEDKFEQAVSAAKEIAGEVTTAAIMGKQTTLQLLASVRTVQLGSPWYGPP